MKNRKVGITGGIADCQTCGKRFECKNAMAVGARHAQLYGHTVVGEVAFAFYYKGEKNEKH